MQFSPSGTNLWVEFNKKQVLLFLKNLYSKEKLSSQVNEVNSLLSFSKIFPQGLIGSSAGDGHALVAVPAAQIEENVEKLDMSNYKKVN